MRKETIIRNLYVLGLEYIVYTLLLTYVGIVILLCLPLIEDSFDNLLLFIVLGVFIYVMLKKRQFENEINFYLKKIEGGINEED